MRNKEDRQAQSSPLCVCVSVNISDNASTCSVLCKELQTSGYYQLPPSMHAWQTHTLTFTHKPYLKGNTPKKHMWLSPQSPAQLLKYKRPTKQLNNIATGNLSTKNITLEISKIFSVWLSLHFPCLFWEALVVICCVFCKSVNIFVQKVILSIKDQQKLCYCPFLVKGRHCLGSTHQSGKKNQGARGNSRKQISIVLIWYLIWVWSAFFKSWQSQRVGFRAGKSIAKSFIIWGLQWINGDERLPNPEESSIDH